MYFTSDQITALTKESLSEFLSNKIPEGGHLDYKLKLPDNKDKGYKEFLKDITSFANSVGGNIIIGVNEPKENSEISLSDFGIEEGVEIAHNLERVATTSVEPPISGLKIVAVQVSDEKHCIVVHVPPSLSKPHMVNHKGHRTFYIRHWESSDPMTTHEIRESVISSLSAEERVKRYLTEKESEHIEYYLEGNPGFILQAVPIIQLETPWDVFNSEFYGILRGNSRANKYKHNYCDLRSMSSPQITMGALCGSDSHNDPEWHTEVHNNGYISATYLNKDIQNLADGPRHVLHGGYLDLFMAFTDLCNEAFEITKTDLPYALQCKYFKANGTVFFVSGYRGNKVYNREEIIWPLHQRNIGQDISEIATLLGEQFYNAFGIKKEDDPT